jgi:predicted transcriptional regulator
MRTVVVSPRSKTLRTLLRQARRKGLILQSPEGEQFVLSPLSGWRAFYIGDSDDFAEEVKATSQNKELMKFLSERTKKSRNSKRTPIEKVREQLGLNSDVEQKSQIAVKEKKANYRASGKKKK